VLTARRTCSLVLGGLVAAMLSLAQAASATPTVDPPEVSWDGPHPCVIAGADNLPGPAGHPRVDSCKTASTIHIDLP
jgi:hypothetical protein